MGRLKYLVILSIFQLHLSSLSAQDEGTFDWMGSSDVCPLNMESIKGQLLNSNHKLEKSLDEQTAEILEHIKKNNVKTNLGVYETFIENTIDKKLLSLQAKTSSGTIETVYLISKIIDEKFSKIEKSNEHMNDRLSKIEEALSSSAKERSTLTEKREKIGEIGRIYDCTLARHLELTTLSTGRYHFNSNHMTWRDAKSFCEKYDMQLVTINSDAEARALVHTKKMTNVYWTSASDIGRAPGQFYWADGQMTEKWIWYSGQPDEYGPGKEACTYLNTAFLIGDLSCTSSYPFICELHPYCKNQ